MIGQTLGHYRIEAQLGAGGMGVVYLAHDITLERLVAVKVLGERLLSEPTARERFLREAKTASSLNHPHVCTVHEVGEDKGQAYIVMEYVEGRPLSEVLANGLLPDAVVRYGMQIADALAHAHECGIVHRDLKTNNVIITPAGRAKVLDFGLAKRLPTEQLAEQPTRSADSLTEAGQIVGTLHYLAPEVLRGRAADTRTDVWALGVLLYELATGDRPFQGKTKFEVTSAILEQPPRPLPASVSAGLRCVIERCLAKEPGERYQRGSEVRAVLEAIQSGSFVPQKRPRRWRLWAAAVALVLASVVTAIRFHLAPGQNIDSIAVLPFANVGGNPDNEYLSDGITESVIGSLSRLSRLRVIAFASVDRYKGRPVDPQQVVRDLGVSAILTGRVTERSDGLSISAELIKASDNSRMWGDEYDATIGGLSSVQDRISSNISETLRLQSRPEEKPRMRGGHSTNDEAYELYLKARYYESKGTLEGYQRSMTLFRKAIEKDPGYAPAYTNLPYVAMTWEGLLPPRDGYAQAEAAVTKALELDDTLSHAHTVLGQLRQGRDWDWPGAESEYRRAIALDPHDSNAYLRYSQFLRAMGRWDEAPAQMKLARSSDPLSVGTNEGLAATYYWARRYDEAIAQLKEFLEIEPNAVSTHDLLAAVYARKGMHKEAMAELRQTFVLNGDKEGAEALGQDFETLGFDRVMRQVNQVTLRGLKESAKDGYVSPFFFATIYAKLGEKDQAFAWLNKAAAERSPWVTNIKTDPEFDGLRSDPRFTELLKLIGLPL
jgi:serine/threonine-protein kinase